MTAPKPTVWSKERQPRGQDVKPEGDDSDPRGVRSVFQQDYDRLLFSTPVRRLADKTQVWPMDDNDGVRTRLTHSHEVANLARSVGTRAHHENSQAFTGADLTEVVQPILAAIGLAHDLGNPPFGHQGERAIGDWFERRVGWIFTHADEKSKQPIPAPIPENICSEFLSFDGNPQTLRLLTRLQTHHSRLGLDLTAGTIAASLKYAVEYKNRSNAHSAKKKGGFFESERDIVTWFRGRTGLGEGQRHPLTWIMEACDDIAYSVLDIDDLLKKGVISPDDVLVMLRHDGRVKSRNSTQKLATKFGEINDSDRHADIKKDIKIQYFRAYMIEALINDASDAFVAAADSINDFSREASLMDGNPLCDALKDIARQYGFSHPSVLRVEAEGFAAIDGLMSAFWDAISDRKDSDLRSRRKSSRSRYIFTLISPNYIEAAEVAASASGPASGLRYRELRLLTDMISGMTDTFAIKLWRDICTLPNANSN